MFETEVKKGERFEFGKNWQSFLSTLTDEKIAVAVESIREMLQIDDLGGKNVLDIGSGSGLFSLAFRKLGAEVHSFDYDPNSVGCTNDLRSRFFPDDPQWVVERASVLDKDFMEGLGQFDIVYSWGVLHHTGDMWAAMDYAASRVKDNGILFVSIYNDQGRASKFWYQVKKLYCSGIAGRWTVSSIFIPFFFSRVLTTSIITRKNRFAGYKKSRGMSITHDWYDWLGGFPFEVAKPEELFHFCRERGFSLRNLKTANSRGINQLVFLKE